MKNYLEYYDNLIGMLVDDVQPERTNQPQNADWLLNMHSSEFCTLIYNLRDNTYEYVSDCVEKLLGFNAPEVIMKGPAGMLAGIHPDYLPWALKVIDKARKLRANLPKGRHLRSQFTISLPLQTRRGGYRWLEIQSMPLKLDAMGNIEFAFMLAQPLPDSFTSTKKSYSFIRMPDESGAIKQLSIAA